MELRDLHLSNVLRGDRIVGALYLMMASMGLPDLVDWAVLFQASRYFFASALLSICSFHNSVTGISRIFSSYNILNPSGNGSPDSSRTEAMGATPPAAKNLYFLSAPYQRKDRHLTQQVRVGQLVPIQ